MSEQRKFRFGAQVSKAPSAAAWVEKYLSDVRPELVVEPDDGTLFLTASGEPFSGNRMTQMVKECIDKAGIGKTGSCHLFRHTMATLMLENGADIRFIQAMLGHAELTTTQIYTQVSIRKLKEIHTATHPARMTRTEGGTATDAGGSPATFPDEEHAALFDALDAEAAEDGE